VVLSAFDILRSEGLVFTHVGRGTFVTGGTAGSAPFKNYRIGFWTHKSRMELFYNRNLFLGAAEKASEAGVTMLLVSDDEPDIQSLVKNKQLDGLLVSGIVDVPLVRQLQKLDIPFVVLGNYDLPPEVNVIESPEITSMVMRQVCDRFKIKSAGAILGGAKLKASRSLELAIKDGVREYAVECRPENFLYSQTEDGYGEAERLLEQDNPPEAVFVIGQAFSGVARYIFAQSRNRNFKRPVIITTLIDKYNIMYPELVDVVIYCSARETGNSGIDEMIKLLNGEISKVKCEGQYPEYEFLR
jgi:DNA-binding LacI/PurR family transcriptional regulator